MTPARFDAFGLLEQYIREYRLPSSGYLAPHIVADILERVLATHPIQVTEKQKDEIIRYFANGCPRLKGESPCLNC